MRRPRWGLPLWKARSAWWFVTSLWVGLRYTVYRSFGRRADRLYDKHITEPERQTVEFLETMRIEHPERFPAL